MFDPHGNLAYSVVVTPPSPAASGTSITLAAGQGARFPDPGAQGYPATVWATGEIPVPTNAEIVRVTAVVGDVLTIQRAQEGTSARTIVAGDQFAATVTAKSFTDIESAIPSTAGLISAINVSAGGAANNLSAITFSNANGVSFGLAGSVLTGTVATNYQPSGNYLTTAALSQDSSKYAGTNGAITGGSLTVNTSGVSINLPAYLTTAMQSDAVTLSNLKVSAGVSSALLSALTFSNSNGLAFGLNAGTLTGSYTVPSAQTAISGIAASNATYTSGTVTFSGVGGGVTVNSNTGQRVDISVAEPVAQTIQTQNLVAVSLSGNTAGVLALASSGTVIFAGGNNITLSQNGQSITISGANAGGAQTAISGIVVSDATYTSGTVSFSNAGNITIASSVNGATQYIKLSGNAAQTTQSAIKAFGVSNTGQTAGNTGVSTGIDWVLAGSGSITLSQSTAGGGPNTVWVQHPAWLTTAALSADSSKYAGTNGAITGGSITVNTSGVSVNLPAYISTQSTQFLALTLGGNTAGTTTFHATNNASLFLNGGNNITLSGNGSTVTISAAAQTIQSAIKGFGATNTGNTAGNTGISTGIDWVVAGTNNITISQSTAGGGPNTIWISGPTVGGAQTGISGIIVSDATYTSGTVSFSNAGNITIASSVNGATQYIKLSGNAAQTNQSAIKGFGVSNTGQTAGNTGISTGIDWVLAGSQSITLSQSTAVGGPNTVWMQHPAWLTTAALSADSSKYAGTNGAITGGSITVNTSGVSINLPAYLTTADLSANSSKYIQEWALTGNTAGTTSSAQGTRLYFSGGNNVTISGNSNSLVFSVGNYLTTAALSQDSSKYAGINGAITGGSITVNTSGVSVNLPAYLTTADLSANSSKYVQEWALTGNTAGTTSSAQGTRLYFSAGNSLTISGSSNSIVFSVGNYITTARRSTDAIGLGTAQTNVTWTVNSDGLSFNAGGYAGTGFTTATTAGTAIVGTHNTAGLSMGVPAFITAAGASPVNISAGTTNSNIGSISFGDSNGVSFGLNGSTITATVSTYDTVGSATTVYGLSAAASVGTVTRWAAEDHRHPADLLSNFDPFMNAPVSNSTLGQSTIYLAPIDVPNYISASRINFFLSIANTFSGAPANSTAWLAFGYGLYTRMTGANSDRISLLTSYSLSYVSASASSSTRLSVTNYIGLSNATSHSTSQYGVNNASVSNYLASSIIGYRALDLPMNLSLTPGRYWVGISNQSASQGASLVLGHSVLQHQFSNNLAYRPLGQVSAASNASFYNVSDGLGIYSAQSAAFPNSIPLTSDSIRGAPVQTMAYFNISGIAMSSNIL